ncbi:MAG: hypothetical protein WBD07_18790 [Vicinamibacterales bacterium]
MTPATSDRRAHEIAAFLGAEPTFVSIGSGLGATSSIESLVPRCTCLIVDAETLAKAADVLPGGLDGLSGLASGVADHVFVHSFQTTERHGAIARVLSSGVLVGIAPQSNVASKLHVTENHRQWCGPFSGLSLGAVDPARDHRFLEASGQQSGPTLIRTGDAPFFVRTEQGGAQVFLLACGELADLDQEVRRQAQPLPWFSRLVPLMMFLRGALGDRVWHNDSPRACFVIDDPLLKNRYGFLKYKRLVEIMGRQRFSTCIAFIPCNYQRSSTDVASLLSSSPWVPSLCVHGCDHTDAEFETTDFDSLRGKARLALDRMRAHQRLSGVPFDDVMVFPRGRFSAQAVAALKASGYLAAINGDVCPASEKATVRDLLQVAVTRFSDFPLFGRRYPRDIAEFAFDVFVGKPAVAVEHHGYFQDGYGALESFVEQLNALHDRLEWTNLATICSRAHLTKTADDGDTHVRFYTSRFTLQNDGTAARRYQLFRRDDDVKIPVTLNPGQMEEISVSDGIHPAGEPWRVSDMHNAKVRARRLLGEFRDNYVDTTRVLISRLGSRRNAC